MTLINYKKLLANIIFGVVTQFWGPPKELSSSFKKIKEKNKKNKRQQKNRKIRMKNNGNLVRAGREGM